MELARFIESLFPLIDQDEKAEKIANDLIANYEDLFANVS